jgi:hypothetical protein
MSTLRIAISSAINAPDAIRPDKIFKAKLDSEL